MTIFVMVVNQWNGNGLPEAKLPKQHETANQMRLVHPIIPRGNPPTPGRSKGELVMGM